MYSLFLAALLLAKYFNSLVISHMRMWCAGVTADYVYTFLIKLWFILFIIIWASPQSSGIAYTLITAEVSLILDWESLCYITAQHRQSTETWNDVSNLSFHTPSIWAMNDSSRNPCCQPFPEVNWSEFCYWLTHLYASPFTSDCIYTHQ